LSYDHRRLVDVLSWIYGREELLTGPTAHVYPALALPCRLGCLDGLLGGLVPDGRRFPATSPLLERLRRGRSRLWNGPTFVLRGLDRMADGPRMHCSRGSYFDAVNTAMMLREELREVAADPSVEPGEAAYRRLRRRHRLHRGATGAEARAQVWSGDGRSAAVGISCLLAVRGVGGYLGCLQRRSATVADDPGIHHLVPSMVFQPPDGEVAPGDGYSLAEAVLRELGEELFSSAEGGERAAAGAAAVAELRAALGDGRAELLLSGLVVDLQDLRPEVLAVLAIHDPGWLDRHGAAVRVCAREYHEDPRAARPDRGVFQPLDQWDPGAPDGPFAPGRCTVGAAAAAVFGIPLVPRPASARAASDHLVTPGSHHA